MVFFCLENMIKIDTEHTSIIFSYEAQEKMLLDFLQYVPYDEINKDTHSPLLENIIINAGSLIDSLFRNWSPKEHIRSTGKKVSRRDLNMRDFQMIYDTKYNFSEKNVFVYLTPPRIISPYEIWSKTKVKKSDWWRDYNEIKHDRVKNRDKATFETALQVLCGLFFLISQNEKMTKALLRHKWLGTGGYNLEILIPSLEDLESKGILGPDTFLIESQLFATTVGDSLIPKELKKIKPLFFHGGNRRLGPFLGVNY